MGFTSHPGNVSKRGFKRRCKLKTFNMLENVGKVRHVVSFHDGVKTHQDNSPFFDVRTFGRKRDANKFARALETDGYVRA